MADTQKAIHIFYFIECMGVTLVNKIIQVSGVQFYDTSSVCCVVFSTPVKSPPIPSSTCPAPFPFVTTRPLSVSVSFSALLNADVHI